MEKLLHEQIRLTLITKFGAAESQWWRQDMPKSVRVSCVTAREEDLEGDSEPYGYTTLIDLGAVLDKQGQLFSARLPKDVSKDKAQFLRDLRRLNYIRNNVMHPTRFRLSDSQWIFNLDTKQTRMTTGTWLLLATLSDGSQHTAWIQLK